MTRRITLLIALVALFTFFVGVTAAMGQADPGANDPDFWCEPDQGIKIEPVDTPFIVPEPPEGTTWTLLVLKGGTTNEVIQQPVVGQGYSHSVSDNSHIILCWETAVVTTTSSSTTTTSTPSTTSTTEPTTTTTDPGSTTSSSTTTTTPQQSTTTTLGTTTTSSPSASTTSSNPSTTAQPTTTTEATTLPNTGLDVDWRVGAALVLFGLVTLGGATLVNGRKASRI